jgi:hypothetical protein
MGAPEEIDAPDELEAETCVGCGFTVEVASPIFLEWDADIVGFSVCPDCWVTTACDDAGRSRAVEASRRRAA